MLSKILPTENETRLIYAIGAITIAVSLIQIALKFWVWIDSNSVAILSSLIDSMLDILISGSTFAAIYYARRPADHDHRYGHGKMEGIAAIFQAAFIAGSCFFVLLEATKAIFIEGGELEVLPSHATLVAGMLGLNFLLLAVQTVAIKTSGSLALEADRANYIGDILTHSAVLISFIAGLMWNAAWIDTVVALVIAGLLLRNALIIGRKAMDMLLDREINEDERQALRKIIRAQKGVLGVHDLRTRASGNLWIVTFDIEVDPSLSFVEAHDISKAVEKALHEYKDEIEVMIHVDPCGDITDSRHTTIKKHHVV